LKGSRYSELGQLFSIAEDPKFRLPTQHLTPPDLADLAALVCKTVISDDLLSGYRKLSNFIDLDKGTGHLKHILLRMMYSFHEINP
jgi:hypothetical protein